MMTVSEVRKVNNFEFDERKAKFHLDLDVKSRDLYELMFFCKICKYDNQFCLDCSVDNALTEIAEEMQAAENIRLAA